MGWLDARDHLNELVELNATSPHIKVLTTEGVDGGQLVRDDALADLDGYLSHFKDWYLSLPPTNEFPKPRKPPTRKSLSSSSSSST